MNSSYSCEKCQRSAHVAYVFHQTPPDASMISTTFSMLRLRYSEFVEFLTTGVSDRLTKRYILKKAFKTVTIPELDVTNALVIPKKQTATNGNVSSILTPFQSCINGFFLTLCECDCYQYVMVVVCMHGFKLQRL